MATLEITNKELQEIYELQKNLFTTSTENNPYLKNNSVNPDLNKGLNTDSKTIIGAINDILAIATSVRDVNTDFIDRFNRIVGNEKLNPELVKRLGAIGSNFYDALFKSWDRANDGYEKAIALENQLEDFKSKIEDLIGIDINKPVDSSLYNTYKDKRYTGNTFTISSTPIAHKSPSVYINGVHYDNECFDITNKNKTFTWKIDDFDITCNYKKSNEYNPIKKYFTKNGENYTLEAYMDRSRFNSGEYYEIDEDLSDEVIVKYDSYSIENENYYKELYNISLVNSVSTSIGKDPYTGELVENYDWSNISNILNKNVSGEFKYTKEGKVHITLNNKDNSIFTTVSNKNWDTFGNAAKVFVGNNANVNSFDDFCNLITGNAINTIEWVSFFAFNVGGYDNIFMITSQNSVETLNDYPVDGNWFYGWDKEKSEALTMGDNSYNPYIDISKIINKLQEAHAN